MAQLMANTYLNNCVLATHESSVYVRDKARRTEFVDTTIGPGGTCYLVREYICRTGYKLCVKLRYKIKTSHFNVKYKIRFVMGLVPANQLLRIVWETDKITPSLTDAPLPEGLPSTYSGNNKTTFVLKFHKLRGMELTQLFVINPLFKKN